jgi:hypothetical protein
MTQLRSSRTRSWLTASIVLASLTAACGGTEAPADAGAADDAAAPPDAGPTNDTGPTSGLGTCAAPRRVTLALGEAMTITGDTRDGEAGPLSLGDACRNVDSTTVPPQEVIAVEVPGSGEVGVAFDLTEGTTATFDTVVEVRTACETTPTSVESCFDDADETEPRSAGAFSAMGGSTIYLVVSGYAMSPSGGAASGAYTMRIEAQSNAAPTLTAATARRVDDDRLEVFATGMDADTNVVGVGLQLLASDGSTIPLDAAVPDDVGPYYYPFDLEVTTASFAMQRATAPGSADFDGIGGATSLRVFTYDVYGVRSATRELTIDMVSEVGFGGSCDATHLCRAPNLCEAGLCVASPETLALCGAATAVTLSAPAGSEPSVTMQSISLAPGVGIATGQGCEYTSDATEKILAVTVPAGAFDLVATTNLASNPAELDTVLYVRTSCENETTELVCDDDYAGAPDGDYRSFAVVENVTAGTHFVFVDGYAPFDAATTIALELRLRPVLATGASCDPAGVQNRCASGACPAGASPTCP